MAVLRESFHAMFEITLTVIMTTFVSSSYCSSAPGTVKIQLNEGWYVSNPNKPDLNFTANIPFTVHSGIFKKISEDPYYRFNDHEYRWIAMEDWLFSLKFVATKTLLQHTQINVVFHSIDTVADVYINGMKIGRSQDKFLKYEFDVTEHLVYGVNKLDVLVFSPVVYAADQSLLYKEKYNYSVLPNCYPKVLHGECHSNFIRKEPCSFGWDFGPSFPTQGLFESVYIEGISAFRIGESILNTFKTQHGWSLHVCIDAYSLKTNVTAFFQFDIIEENSAKNRFKKILDAEVNTVCTVIEMDPKIKVKEWWPKQYGSQDMYTLQITISNSVGQQIDSKTIRFGFRTIELVQEPIPGSNGLSFYFKINGIEIFLKGSNWIPADALRDRVTDYAIQDYLQSAIDANMNVLRVWGGGGFESDFFYDTCDQLGLLIWHDLMFACAMYPTDPRFLDLVTNETVYQLKRLMHHPSIIIWSGNNENEVALRENWYGTDRDYVRYKTDYVDLYVKNLREVVKNIDKSRPFIVSSPSNGDESEREGWISQDPKSPLFGDVHYYNYTADCWDPEVFPKPRFASEYGYQSYPSIESLERVSLPRDLIWNSTLMYYRQHHQDGNKQIENIIKLNFKIPKSTDASVFFRHMVYLSQIVQAVCITFETEHYRQLRSRLVRGTSNGSVRRNQAISANQYDHSDKTIVFNINQRSDVKIEQHIIHDQNDHDLTDSSIKADGEKHRAQLESNSQDEVHLTSHEERFVGKETRASKNALDVSDTIRDQRDLNDRSIISNHQSDFSSAGEDSTNPGNAKQKQFDEAVRQRYSSERNTESETLFGFTMGAMYWQLNGIWQAPSWGSIEYGGRWKMLHYHAVNFFRDFAVSYHKRGDHIDIFVVSDLREIVFASITVTAYNWSSLQAIKRKSIETKIQSQMATLVMKQSINDWCEIPQHCFLILSIDVQNAPKYSYSRPAFLAPFSNVDTLMDPKPNIPQAEMVQVSNRTVRFTIHVEHPAAFLWLSTSIPGRFSDNGFVQYQPWRTLYFMAQNDISVDQFSSSLRHMSLYDTLIG